MARILFPLSFGLFNLTYWYSYFHAQKPFDWDDHMLKGKSIFLFFIFQLCIHHEVFCRNFFRTSKSKEKSQLSRLTKMQSFLLCTHFSIFLVKVTVSSEMYFWPQNTYGRKYIFFTCASEYHSASWCLKILLNVSFLAQKNLNCNFFSLRHFLDFQTLWTYCQNTNYFFADNQIKNCYLLYI